MKKALSLILIFMMVTMTAITAFANESKAVALQSLPYDQKLERLEWHEYDGLDSIDIEETYTYDELVTYLKNNGFTEKEAFDFVGERPIETRSTSIHYSLFKMQQYTHKKDYKVQFRVNAGLEYNSGSSSPNRIVSLGGAHVYTGGGSKCAFAGDIFYELPAGNEFYYNYYGKLYRSGQPNGTVGVTIGVGDSASITASISNGNGEIDDVDHNETYTSAGLDP